MARCLVVEDSAELLGLTSAMVRELGLDVQQARGPADAADALATQKPDIVLLDFDLPRQGALDILQAIVQAPARPTVVLLATENDPKQLALARAAGAAYSVLKPYDAEDIEAVMKRAGILGRS